jgi:hypothetical protein
VQVDLATVGSLLESGAIDAMSIYTGSESSPPPWLSEASLAADWAALNPNADEIAEFKKMGFSVVEVSPKIFNRDVHADKVVELPFYYSFNVGLDVPEADVYEMLNIIEKHAAELASTDPTFAQIAKDMKGFQKRGVQSSVDLEGRVGSGMGFQDREEISSLLVSRTSDGGEAALAKVRGPGRRLGPGPLGPGSRFRSRRSTCPEHEKDRGPLS